MEYAKGDKEILLDFALSPLGAGDSLMRLDPKSSVDILTRRKPNEENTIMDITTCHALAPPLDCLKRLALFSCQLANLSKCRLADVGHGGLETCYGHCETTQILGSVRATFPLSVMI